MDKDIKFEYYLVTNLFERIVTLESRVNDLENKLSYSKKTTFDYKDSDNDAFNCINGANTDNECINGANTYNERKQDIKRLIESHKKSESK